ncbi:MAG: sulfatase-like hydrolase/transferase [Candidatus Hydrogenedentes bacterium]|nr:sulfatase-like hydrolase/transferase [Candidatus Hydrogenedentota bacterium]
MPQLPPVLSRRAFIGSAAGVAVASLAQPDAGIASSGRQPNVLFVMTDQQRADAIHGMGNSVIYTPNMDRLVQRGAAFSRGYSTCPVCVPARYTIRTGCEPHTTGIYHNGAPDLVAGQPEGMEERCGDFLARTMSRLGYRTFGIGKFHTTQRNEDVGFDTHLHSEEMYGSQEDRARDAYASYIANEHPRFNYIEDFMGERSAHYYVPQTSLLPPELTCESWAADRAVELISKQDSRPYFGFVSFVGPHPPIAPPIPFNRMYNPDKMPNPVRGDAAVDAMDEQITWMNHAVWAEDINDSLARKIRARYYGMVSHIDQCLGRILDAVEARDDADNTVIVFYSDHGDHLGDHGGWQKESFFDVACRVPYLVSWPAAIAPNQRRDEIVCLTDLFGIATTAAGTQDLRQGKDVLGLLARTAQPREHLIGLYGIPGTPRVKVMVREKDWKYIYLANGAREQLFNLTEDPMELRQRIADSPEVAARLKRIAAEYCNRPNLERAIENNALRAFPFEARPLQRILQFDRSRGVKGFPQHPSEVVTGKSV